MCMTGNQLRALLSQSAAPTLPESVLSPPTKIGELPTTTTLAESPIGSLQIKIPLASSARHKTSSDTAPVRL